MQQDDKGEPIVAIDKTVYLQEAERTFHHAILQTPNQGSHSAIPKGMK